MNEKIISMFEIMLTYKYLYASMVFIGSLLCCVIVMPSVISVANFKNLMADSNTRSSHIQQTPTLGGIAFFICIMMGLFFLSPVDQSGMSTHLMAAITILFIVGLKDDLTVLSARTKFLAQLLAIGFVFMNPDIIISNLHGFMGLYEISQIASVLGSAFLIVAIINAYNLIDGIDGLAGGIGTVISLCFAAAFFVVGLYFYAFIGLVSAGYLIGFLRFNLSTKRKIFMGDTGSLIAGFVIAVLAIRLLAMDVGQIERLHLQAANLFVMIGTVLFLPFLDTIRVFTIRILNGKSPFRPDNNHIHHLLIRYGMSHKKASALLITINVLYIALFYTLNTWVHSSVFLGLFVLSGVAALLLLTNYNRALQKRSHTVVRNFFRDKARIHNNAPTPKETKVEKQEVLHANG